MQTSFEDLIVHRLFVALLIRGTCTKTCRALEIIFHNNAVGGGFRLSYSFAAVSAAEAKAQLEVVTFRLLQASQYYCSVKKTQQSQLYCCINPSLSSLRSRIVFI